MGVAIILRSEANLSLYKEIMMSAIKSEIGNNALLCSGFFQENQNGHLYRVTDEFDFEGTEFINCFPKSFELKIVGVYNNIWREAYNNFARSLASNTMISMEAYLKTSFNWHAKVFILRKDEKPIMGIIGSSNMTRRAFGSCDSTRSGDYNVESDAIIWCDNKYSPKRILEKNIDSYESHKHEKAFNPHNIINLRYDMEDNYGLNEEERLEYIYEEILNDSKLKRIVV